ncbi:MAG: HAD family hydrolase [Caldilineaceae bacterium]|nr:HAD family hydrolase [Caldilineaceae bacterium]
MIHAVIFDMDETLLDRQSSLRAFAAAQHRAHPDAFSEVPVAHFVERFLALDNNGALWKAEVYQQILDENRITSLEPQTLVDEYIADFHRHCHPFAGLPEMVDELLADGRQLGLITNGRYPFQWHNFQSLGVADRFGAVLVSEHEGMRKPNPEIFRRALSRLDVTAETAVFVGDNPEADMRGAQSVGMRTIYRPSPFWPECAFADAVCTDLRQLPGLVRGFEASR